MYTYFFVPVTAFAVILFSNAMQALAIQLAEVTEFPLPSWITDLTKELTVTGLLLIILSLGYRMLVRSNEQKQKLNEDLLKEKDQQISDLKHEIERLNAKL